MTWKVLAFVTLLVTVVLIGLTYGQRTLQIREVQAVTNRFWLAVTTGDQTAVNAMLAPDSPVPTKVWLEQNTGMTYFPAKAQIFEALKNSCGLEMVANTSVSDSSHRQYGRTINLKSVNGRWLVYQGDGRICP